MKIRLSELRQVIREEIANVLKEGADDNAAYENIMAMITSALGDSPETKKIGSQLQGAMQSKQTQPTAPATISMKSIANPNQQKTPQTQSPNTFSMTSVAQKPAQQ